MNKYSFFYKNNYIMASINSSLESYNSYNNNYSNINNYAETPHFNKNQELYGQSNSFNKNYCDGASGVNGKTINIESTPVSMLFFSDDNINRIQKMIKQEILRVSNGVFRLDTNQDESDLFFVMRAVYLDQGKDLSTHYVRQVKILNKRLMDYMIPDILTNIKQAHSYLRDITRPITPIPLPIQANNKGRKTLPAYNTLW